MLAQISSAATATAGIIVALLSAAAAVAKKYIGRQKSKPEYITRAEFHLSMDATRDRIGASYLALADKIEMQHNQVLTKLDRQGANFERRIDQLESNLARLDERSRTIVPHPSITPLRSSSSSSSPAAP
jgi:hypothetical protein